MGCNACDKAQDDVKLLYFLRVGSASVLVLGCSEHVAELRRVYLIGLVAEHDSKAEDDAAGPA